MMEAYVLVEISADLDMYGQGRTVIEKMRKIPGVETAELLFGDYDAIIKLNMPKIHEVENLVIEEISMIEGVRNTITLLCVDEEILR
jgi:DNA-binding Lrp family transcriptional regulator